MSIGKRVFLLALWCLVIYLSSSSGVVNQAMTTGGAFSLSEQGGAEENPPAIHSLIVQKTDAPCCLWWEGWKLVKFRKSQSQAAARGEHSVGRPGCLGHAWPSASWNADFKQDPRKALAVSVPAIRNWTISFCLASTDEQYLAAGTDP